MEAGYLYLPYVCRTPLSAAFLRILHSCAELGTVAEVPLLVAREFRLLVLTVGNGALASHQAQKKSKIL